MEVGIEEQIPRKEESKLEKRPAKQQCFFEGSQK